MATTDAGAGLPRWAANGVLPLVNLVAAFVVSGIVIMILGESPVEAMLALVRGAFGFSEAWGYTLYYATNFIFTALAFSIAMHCGLFNIGSEGQGYIGGLGVGLVCLYLDALPLVCWCRWRSSAAPCSARRGGGCPLICRRNAARTS